MERDDEPDYEPRPRERRATRGPGLALTLFGAGLLTAAGFAVGLVVGASWEDPDLLASHLSGRTEPVDVAGLTEAPPVPEVAAPPPLGGAGDEPAGADFGEAPPVEQEVGAPATGAGEAADPLGAGVALPEPPRRAPAPAPRPKPEPAKRAAPAPSGGGFAVQVGAFQERPPAAALSNRLERSGFPAYVAVGEAGSGQRWRVRVGPVKSRGEADELARRLKSEEGLPTWVVSDAR